MFSVDYSDEIDLLVSGSADMTVKLWSFSTGILIYSQHVYTEWATKVSLPVPINSRIASLKIARYCYCPSYPNQVILHKCAEDCEWGKRGSYILLGQVCFAHLPLCFD